MGHKFPSDKAEKRRTKRADDQAWRGEVEAMGPQPGGELIELLQECETVAPGILGEIRS